MDFEHIGMLFHVAEKALTFGSKFKHIHDAALSEVERVAKQPAEQPVEEDTDAAIEDPNTGEDE